MENPIKMDDLGVPLFLETPMSQLVLFLLYWEKIWGKSVAHQLTIGVAEKS